MKRIGRWLFNLAAGVSLLLWLTAVVLWVRSYWAGDLRQIDYFWARDEVGPFPENWQGRIAYLELWLVTADGRFMLVSVYNTVNHTLDDEMRPGWNMIRQHGKPAAFDPAFSLFIKNTFLGFGLFHTTLDESSTTAFQVPYWAPAIIFCIIPLIWARSFHSARFKRRAGLCSVCGYDLRATPDRCPECGTIPAAAKGATT